MPLYLVKIASFIKRSKNKIVKMKEDYELYKKYLETKDPNIYKQEKQKIFGLNKEEINRSPQESMKKNPYYWYHELKQKAYDYMFPEEKYKLLEGAKTNIEKTSPHTSKIPSIVKKPFLMVIDAVNYLVKKVSFGYIDLKSNMTSMVEKTNVKHYLVIIQNKTYLLILVTKNTIITFAKKYQDRQKNEEFLKNQRLLEQKIDEHSKKANSYFKRFNIFSFISLSFSNKFSLMDKYVNSSYFRRKYMELKYVPEDIIKDYKKNRLAYMAHKVLNFFSIKRILRMDSTKKKLKHLLINLTILYIIFLVIKICYYRLKSNKIDNQYKETLRLFKELKAQNEEILKNNQMIMEENIRLRKRDD